MAHRNNQLPENLPQLQNLIKRDPASYNEEFMLQYRHFQSTIEIFRLRPDQNHARLGELIMFLAQVAHCYPETLSEYAQELVDILQKHNSILDPAMRMILCRALILLRNRGLLSPSDLLSLFFQLLRSQDKQLRTFLENHIITDIKNINSKHKNMKVNNVLQNFMYGMMKDTNPKAAKMSVDIMIALYRKNIWKDTKTVNVIATACFSKFTKVMVAALKFFLSQENDENESDEESDGEKNISKVGLANKVNKKSRKREKKFNKLKQEVQKKKNKEKAPVFNFSALHLIHDPQAMAEKLLKQLTSCRERFEVKLMMMDVISRLIGLHQLFVFNFYPYLQKFMMPHQRDVTNVLLFAAQAAHELIPPETIQPVLKSIVYNFVTERNSSDAMAIGINAVRELCCRCPLAMTDDLLQDLSQYKTFKERSVMMAARSLVNFYRTSMPELLHSKDRGRPTEASVELRAKKYGEIDSKECVPGAEILLEPERDESDSDNEEDEKSKKDNEKNKISTEEAKKLAFMISSTKLLTDEDFERIEVAQQKKAVTGYRKGVKRPAPEEEETKRGELVNLSDIEQIYKKQKRDKAARLESMRKGQETQVKFGFKDHRINPFCSKTNLEKTKKKPFTMIKHKAAAKTKRSFRDKQIALRNHLLKIQKMK